MEEGKVVEKDDLVVLGDLFEGFFEVCFDLWGKMSLRGEEGGGHGGIEPHEPEPFFELRVSHFVFFEVEGTGFVKVAIEKPIETPFAVAAAGIVVVVAGDGEDFKTFFFEELNKPFSHLEFDTPSSDSEVARDDYMGDTLFFEEVDELDEPVIGKLSPPAEEVVEVAEPTFRKKLKRAEGKRAKV